MSPYDKSIRLLESLMVGQAISIAVKHKFVSGLIKTPEFRFAIASQWILEHPHAAILLASEGMSEQIESLESEIAGLYSDRESG